MLLFFLLHGVFAWNKTFYLQAEWSVRDADGYPRPVIVLRDRSLQWRDDIEVTRDGGHRLFNPTLCVNQGDMVEVYVTNLLSDAVISIHWHGLHMINNSMMDGVAGLTQDGILPMRSFLYRFQITQKPGTYFYHSHSGLQSSDGLQGALIILPVKNTMDIARDYVVWLQDWNHELYHTLLTKYLARNNAYDDFIADYPYPAASILINGIGQFDCEHAIVTYEDCNDVRRWGWQYILQNRNESFRMQAKEFSYQTNGQCNPSRLPFIGPCRDTPMFSEFECIAGRNIKLRIVGAGFSLGMRFWIDRHTMTLIAKDGVDIEPMIQDAVFIMPGERIDVLVACDQESMSFYMFAMIAYEYYGKNAHLKSPNVSSVAILRYVDGDQQLENGFWPNVANETTNVVEPFLPPTSWPLNTSKPIFFYPSRKKERIQPALERFVIFSQSKGHWWNYEPHVEGRRLEWWELNEHIPFFLPRTTLLQTCASDDDMDFTTLYNNQTKPLIFHLEYVPQNPITYEFILINNESQPHPWHVHGHTVDVIKMDSIGIWDWTNPLVQEMQWGIVNSTASTSMKADTFVIPSKSYVQFRLVANNPGPWLVHCHMPYHSEVGMAFLLSVEYNKKECCYQIPCSISTDQTIVIDNFDATEMILLHFLCLVPLCFCMCFCMIKKWALRVIHKRKLARIAPLNADYTQDIPIGDNFKVNEKTIDTALKNEPRQSCCC